MSSTTILKGMQVMEFLAHAKGPRGISEIALAIDMNKSAVQRILNTFLEAGYVERADSSRKYQLTLSIWELGSYIVSQHVARRQIHPVLRFASQSTGCTAFLAYLSFPFMVYLDKVEGAHGRANSSEPGRRIPIGPTASGLAALAFVPEKQLQQLSRATTDWTGHVSFDGMPPNNLTNELVQIRGNGYASSFSAMTRGVNAVAAPIWWKTSMPYGSLVLTADEKNMSEDEIASFGNKVRYMAEEATIALGGAEFRQEAERQFLT